MVKKLFIVVMVVLSAFALAGCGGKDRPSNVPGLTVGDKEEVSKLAVEITRAFYDRSLFLDTDRYKDKLTKIGYKSFNLTGERMRKNPDLVKKPRSVKLGKPMFVKQAGGDFIDPSKRSIVVVVIPVTVDGQKDILRVLVVREPAGQSGSRDKHVWKSSVAGPTTEEHWKSLNPEYY